MSTAVALPLRRGPHPLDFTPRPGRPRIGQRCRIRPAVGRPGTRPGTIEALVNINDLGWPRELVVRLDPQGDEPDSCEIRLLCEVEILT